MFSKNNKKTGGVATPPSPPAPPSIISRDLSIVGDLLSDGEIQVDGTVKGDVRTRVLVVGETANVKGEIVAETVHILGSVDGQIKAKEVKLAASAHVVGDILHEDLSIETGAFLEGHCKRMALPEEIHKIDKDGPKKTGTADIIGQRVRPTDDKAAPKPVKEATP